MTKKNASLSKIDVHPTAYFSLGLRFSQSVRLKCKIDELTFLFLPPSTLSEVANKQWKGEEWSQDPGGK